MGATSKNLASQYHRMLKLVETNDGGTVINESIAFPAKERKKSGVRAKIVPPPLSDVVWEPNVQRQNFLVIVHYHYFTAVFPNALQEELRQLEGFFDIGRNQRGEGTTVQCDRLLATMTYRLSLKPANARGFRKTLCNLLERHGVEIIRSELEEA